MSRDIREAQAGAPQNRLVLPRRRLLVGSLALAATLGSGGIALASADRRKTLLDAASRFNDRVQAGLFSPSRLCQTYAPSEITSPFPFNAFYTESMAPEVDTAAWRLRVTGRVANQRGWSLDALMRLEHESQITRLICIEGWSAVGKWSGVPLRRFLELVGADLQARYVSFHCEDDYWCSIDMASALHAQTILATHFLDRPLPAAFGAPLRLRIPVKLGFKNAKHVSEIRIADEYAGGYWEDQGYNWFAGL